jgi:2-oxoisovalerate dehydrogenase E2 component (dihydrolipoyl transacylase)
MSRYVFKLPDLGEGTVEAEIIGWRVVPGDVVREDDIIVEVMTEKAAIEVPSPVSGRVLSCTGEPGESVAVGSELIVFETEANAARMPQADPVPPSKAVAAVEDVPEKVVSLSAASATGRVKTSPANRRRAKEAGVDLTQVEGSGPHGRITRDDLQSFLDARGRTPTSAMRIQAVASGPATEEIKVIGVRRVIANRMAEAKRTIPHFSYIEEVDVTELESLRQHLSEKQGEGEPALSYLPFIGLALLRALAAFPQCNAHYDAERNVLIRHRALHLGVATQTREGLKVPVVRDVGRHSLRELAAEIRRVAQAARDGTAKREELTGSTCTLSSLGKLGGIAATPIINAPEVAIVGVNKAVERPVVDRGAITIRRMMNLSASFDHRFVDGYDGAAMIQALKEYLEHPATIFIE